MTRQNKAEEIGIFILIDNNLANPSSMTDRAITALYAIHGERGAISP